MSNLLEIKNLTVEYNKINSTEKNVIKALNNVSLNIKKGEIYALAGESGSGKSTLAKVIMKLLKPKNGDILFNGKSIFSSNKIENKNYPKKVQMVFQNPYSSLNPKMKINEILREPLDINTNFSLKEKNIIISETLEEVGLTDAILKLYPHNFSGGQRQRIAIARALILNPELLIADEPVSALDASIQAQILNLLNDLRQKRELTILFISHDMNVIKFLSDRVGILYLGKLIEENYTGTVFRLPREDYTKKLLNSVPTLNRYE